jgi:hypothetical protein
MSDSAGNKSSTIDKDSTDSFRPIGGGIAAGSGVAVGVGAPRMVDAQNGKLLYRSLAKTDPYIAEINKGASITPSDIEIFDPTDPKNTRENVTLRQLRPNGDKSIRGTNRISVTSDLEGIIKYTQERPDRFTKQEFIQIDPKKLGNSELLKTPDLLNDLDKIKEQTQSTLDQRAKNRAANGQNPTKLSSADKRATQKLAAVERAKADANVFKESHVVGEIPPKAAVEVTPGQVKTASRILKGAKIGGGALAVVGIGLSVKRVIDAPEEQRSRVITQEVGSTAGGIAGGIAGAKLGAAIGIAGGPVGIAVGAVVGGLVGGAIGGALSLFAADKAFDLFS